MASVLRWFRRVASRLCCGGEIVKKDEFEAYPEGSLAGDGEQSSDESSAENQSEFEDPGHATDTGREDAFLRNTGDDISTVMSTADMNLDPTAAGGDAIDPPGYDTLSGVKDTSTTHEQSTRGDVHSAERESFLHNVAILEEDCPQETASEEDRMRIHYKVLEYAEDTREFAPVRPDVFVCTEGREYSVHSRVLTRFSEFFRQKLEGREGLDSVVFLPSESVSDEALETLLRFLYYGILLFSNRQKMEAVVKASRYLGIGEVEEMLGMQK